jgi:mannose-6-phosphate isomerase-like protein (cupin superfamily)
MSMPPALHPLAEIPAHHITAGDTVKLAVLSGPEDGSGTSVCFEVWEPGGSQPPNSHSGSTETFVVLAGRGLAHSDEHLRELGPGDVLVLPPGSVHRIENTSSTERLYTITVMAPDAGFAKMITDGPAATLDEADLAVLGAVV